MGESKALLDWHGQPLIAYVVQSVAQAGYGPTVVVLGHAASEIAAAVPPGIRVRTIVNERHAEGRSTSVIAGVEALAETAPEAVLIASVDQPRSAGMLRSLREAWEAATPALAVPSLDGRAGHPVLFHARLLGELANVSEEREGLREVVGRHRSERLLVPTSDPLTLTNLNTLDDYRTALGEFHA